MDKMDRFVGWMRWTDGMMRWMDAMDCCVVELLRCRESLRKRMQTRRTLPAGPIDLCDHWTRHANGRGDARCVPSIPTRRRSKRVSGSLLLELEGLALGGRVQEGLVLGTSATDLAAIEGHVLVRRSVNAELLDVRRELVETLDVLAHDGESRMAGVAA